MCHLVGDRKESRAANRGIPHSASLHAGYACYKLVDEYLKMEKTYDVKTAYTNEFLDKSVKMPPINPPKLY